jgi:KUP system potassium uptake protein
MTVRYGFIEIPDIPAALRGAKTRGCPIDFAKAVYFSARDLIVRDRKGRHLSHWRLALYSFLFRNSVHAVDIFNLPRENFVEIGREIEI